MADSSRPVVSLVLLCFNHERYLEQALRCVEEQSYDPIEVIICDDGSSDGSRAIIEAWCPPDRFVVHRVLNDVNSGICATLNRAVEHVTGEFVAMLATDDWMEPERIEHQVAMFSDLGDDVCLTYVDLQITDDDGALRGETWLEKHPFEPQDDEGAYLTLLRGTPLPTPGVMMRTASLRAAGPYDEALTYEDYDMWLRISENATVAGSAEPLVNYRRHDKAMTLSRWTELETQFLTILDKHVGRTPEADRIIGQRFARIVKRLYISGLPAGESARRLRLAMQLDSSTRTPTNLAYLALATARVDGRWLARLIGAVRERRATHRPPKRVFPDRSQRVQESYADASPDPVSDQNERGGI
jgi:hypothetical protein